MTRIRLTRVAAVPLTVLALGLGLTGCGGGDGDPGVATARSGGASPSAGGDADQQARAYAQCLRDAGVAMTEEGDGAARVDKEKTAEKTIRDASEKCRDLQPAAVGTGAPRLSEDDIDKRRQYASCIRRHGVKDYPDPDPRTGESVLDDALARKLKGDAGFEAAVTACRDILPSPTASGVQGG